MRRCFSLRFTLFLTGEEMGIEPQNQHPLKSNQLQAVIGTLWDSRLLFLFSILTGKKNLN
jgi:hypothetical protein